MRWMDLAVLLWVPALGAYYLTARYVASAYRQEDGNAPRWARTAAVCAALVTVLMMLGPTYERVMRC